MQRILLDVDGVCADFMNHLLRQLTWEAPHLEVPKEEDIKTVRLKDSLSPELLREALMILERPEFWAGIPQYPEAREYVPRLVSRHRVRFVTAPWISCEDWEGVRRRWLAVAYGVTSGAMISTSDKASVDGDLFIDDQVSMVADWQKAHPQGRGIVLARPWNHSEDVVRWTWPEVIAWIERND